ncbi:MAG: CHAP domain-containing protein [Streptococcus gallolyticus]|uniref:CHAP domain-containing protein n=1 Tax=Streptococcus gallolyticus TaxID=315405 RepID=A0A927XE85_9STRE|nr:CHAP domain-containing protein [Streptococcus gallolyticus]
MKKLKHVKRLGCLTVLLAPFLLVLVFITLLFHTTMTSNDCEVSSSSTSTATVSSVASDTDWTHEGSTAYNNAKLVFDSWISKGLSGASASGIVGWVNSEGGFALVDRAEGHYGTDELTNGLSAGVIPSGGSGYSVGGGGIYQFTPYTKFAEAGDSKWLDVDAQNTFVAQAILSGDWNASMDLTGGNHSFQQMAQMTDPQQATLVWQAYERGNTAYIDQSQKQADAQTAYNMFNGASYSYDESKFNAAFGTSSSDSSSDSNYKVSAVSTNNCSSSSSGGGTGSWSVDGGTVSYSAYNAWKRDDLPDDLKQYALDPASVGLGFKDSTGWNAIAYSGGQCTDFSASLMYALWEKDGEHVSMTLGNGQDIAKNWASRFLDKVSTTPTAGAVFSQTPSSAGNDVGHTGVVSHVFANGDILVVEQNYADLSGENGGFGKYTWSYRYVPTSQYASGWSFYDPSNAGYSIASEVSSVG